MIQCIRTTERIARKEHICDGFRDVFRSLGFRDLQEIVTDTSELVFLIEMKDRGYKIQKGERYLEEAYVGDGELYTLRVSKPMKEIMDKYNLYDNEW